MRRKILGAALVMLFGSGAWAHESGDDRLERLMRELERLKAEIQKLKRERAAAPAVNQRLRYSNEGGRGGHMVFFRGGYARLTSDRARDVLPSVGDRAAKGQNGFYIGAGFDFSLSPNFFGLGQAVGGVTPNVAGAGTGDLVTDFLNRTEVVAELMFEYKRFAQGVGLIGALNLSERGNRERSTVTQFTLTAAPKLKFLRGSMIRPWIIPVGFGLHVISPPSDGVTVLNPGLVFGVGADVNVWKNFYVGADFRYHVTPERKSSLSGVESTDTDGLTAGGYIGIGF